MFKQYFKIFLIPLVFIVGFGQTLAAVIESSITPLEISDENISKGKELYEAKCTACHGIDQKLVGPALKDVHKKYNYEWLLKWIRNNEELRKSGDKDAIAIYEEYNGAAMNLFTDLSDEQIGSIILYIEDASAGGGKEAAADETSQTTIVEADQKDVVNINTMIFLIFILFIVILITVIKILGTISKLTGRQIVNANNFNAFLFGVFYVVGMILIIYELRIHGKHILPDAASVHGVMIDTMMRNTLIITGIVFFVTQFLLFYFAVKYRYKKDRKALYYPVNDKLELIWTIIPAIVLAVLVLGGLKVWRNINSAEMAKNSSKIEVFGYQFGWTARYPGADGKLGQTSWNFISGSNQLGLAQKDKNKELINDVKKEIAELEQKIKNIPYDLGQLKATYGGLTGDDKKSHYKKIKEYESGAKLNEYKMDIQRKRTQIARIERSFDKDIAKEMYDGAGTDDIITTEIHIPVDEAVTLKFRGRDVIHSAYLPYFRTQMNVVPGLPTEFTFTPTVTTKEMRSKLNNLEFDYHIVCNKICGNAHFNMKMKVVVESKEEYTKWLRTQNSWLAGSTDKNETESLPNDSASVENNLAIIN